MNVNGNINIGIVSEKPTSNLISFDSKSVSMNITYLLMKSELSFLAIILITTNDKKHKNQHCSW